MNNSRRRNFRSRSPKNNFRRRNGSVSSNNVSNFNGNNNFTRNGSMSNPYNVEKTIQKFQQLAKDSQSSGDPVLVENYLQHADHYSRRLVELNDKFKNDNNDKFKDNTNDSEFISKISKKEPQ